MLNTNLMKAVRWILYIPIIIIELLILNFGIVYAANNVFDFWWFIAFAIMGRFIYLLIFWITTFTVYICPNQKIGGYIYSIFATLIFLRLNYLAWFDLETSLKFAVAVTILTLITGWYTIISALYPGED